MLLFPRYVSPVAAKLMFNVTQTQMRVDIGLLLVESVAVTGGARWRRGGGGEDYCNSKQRFMSSWTIPTR